LGSMLLLDGPRHLELRSQPVGEVINFYTRLQDP
jgi:hypothetical protein